MAEAQANSSAGKGKAFFDRADEVAGTGNWDFAIELYLEGIKREPGNIERGHLPLREVSLKRKATGGKAAGMIEGIKRRPVKDPLENLVRAEYLLAKDPGSVPNMVQTLKAAQGLGQTNLIDWIGRILLDSQRQGKPKKAVLIQVADAFEAIEEYTSALAACHQAYQLSSDDAKLADRIKDLSAQETIKKGKYDEEGDLSRAVKDMDGQQDLMQKNAMVQSGDYLRKQINLARKAYEDSPTVQGKVIAVVDALLKTDDIGDQNEAIDVLAKAHKDTNAYQFKMRIGDIKIRQMNARYQKLKESGDKEAALAAAREQLDFELAEYTDRAENYPTDLPIKYELGKRQFLAGQYDEAIGSFQQAQRDPRRHVQSLNYLGQAFAKKGWNQEAAETYERALEAELPESRKKDVLYNIGDIYEKMDQLDKAEAMFSDLAQLDFNYRDVRDRLDQVRKKKAGPGT